MTGVDAYQTIELPLRDITEELKSLNKQLEILNETFLTMVYIRTAGPASVINGRDKARSYLADRIKQ